jgi:hypothetical protein
MESTSYPLLGAVVPLESLTIPRAEAVATYAASPRSPYVTLVECRRKDGYPGSETVIVDLDIEVAQKPVYPVLPRERMAITVVQDDSTYPEISVLRPDFPRVPHLNLGSSTGLKTLCLYEEPLAELRLHWTARHAIERIREWLAKTADGKLHPDDQPLEPLLALADGTLVMPLDLFNEEGSSLKTYVVSSKDQGGQRPIWFVRQAAVGTTEDQKPPTHVATLIQCPARTHGLITAPPHTLDDLDKFLSPASLDIVAELRGRIAHWKEQKQFDKLRKCRLFIVLAMPKCREEGAPPESTEYAAFHCFCELGEMDRLLENFRVSQQHSGLIQIPDEISAAANVRLAAFDIAPCFSPEFAASCNDCATEDRRFVLVGAGALGSQVYSNLMRAGFGKWVVVDDDRLMPHNLARHWLTAGALGLNKAVAIRNVVNNLLNTEVVTAIPMNILQPGDAARNVAEIFSESTAVLDCSASVPVARHLALTESGPRRTTSAFLNPAGDALILLTEDTSRKCRLDWLEMQYYRELIRNPLLQDHLRTSRKTRYANSCRSVTSKLRQDYVAIFSGIASSAFREAIAAPDASIRLWSLNDSLEVKHLAVKPEPVVEYAIGEWRVCTDLVLLKKVARLRLLRLPNETGGILLGAFDMTRRIIYVVDAMLSPPDSEEWPTSYKRGTNGLSEQSQTIQKQTLGNLEYVGEWHSHPNGCSTNQSATDELAMADICSEMSLAGMPGLMLIVGQSGAHTFHIGNPELHIVEPPEP